MHVIVGALQLGMATMDVKGYGVSTHIVYTFEHLISLSSNNSCNGSERSVKVKRLHLDGNRLVHNSRILELVKRLKSLFLVEILQP